MSRVYFSHELIYKYTLLVCLFVCLFVTDTRQNGWTNRAQIFFWEPHIIPGKVYGCLELKHLCLKNFYISKSKKKDNRPTLKVKNGREAPWTPSILKSTQTLTSLRICRWWGSELQEQLLLISSSRREQELNLENQSSLAVLHF